VNEPNISIIIPARNEERHLKRCLDSIAAQTAQPYEVIVVDNGSTDTTSAVAASYSFVRVLHENQVGIVYARNAGFDAAQGDIIARIDADVTLPADWIERVGLFYADSRHADVGLSGNGRPDNLPFPHVFGWLQGEIAFRVNRLLLGHYIFFGSNMAMPAHFWRELRSEICLRTDIHEDLDLAIHAHRLGHQIAYQETLQVTGRAARVVTNRNELLGNLMMWPRTLQVHHIATWVFGWLGAIGLYALSPIPLVLTKLAGVFGWRSQAD
jgi:glycosyltransferase involved in cell wall biosynthesis